MTVFALFIFPGYWRLEICLYGFGSILFMGFYDCLHWRNSRNNLPSPVIIRHQNAHWSDIDRNEFQPGSLWSIASFASRNSTNLNWVLLGSQICLKQQVFHICSINLLQISWSQDKLTNSLKNCHLKHFRFSTTCNCTKYTYVVFGPFSGGRTNEIACLATMTYVERENLMVML